MTTLEVLTAAKAKIDTPEKWAQRKFATTVEFYECDPNNPLACRWCALGAIRAVSPTEEWQGAEEALTAHIGSSFDDVADYNDAEFRTHNGIMRLFDRAIADYVA